MRKFNFILPLLLGLIALAFYPHHEDLELSQQYKFERFLEAIEDDPDLTNQFTIVTYLRSKKYIINEDQPAFKHFKRFLDLIAESMILNKSDYNPRSYFHLKVVSENDKFHGSFTADEFKSNNSAKIFMTLLNEYEENVHMMTSQLKTEKATFAGGCFWCIQPVYEGLEGVLETEVGYTGGVTVNPSYEQVVKGDTGHAEAISLVYDPSKITYRELLDLFWRNIDPYDSGGQFCDRGSQYRTAIFYHSPEQRKLAFESVKKLEDPKKVATEITAASEFYSGENYHQNYSEKEPFRYKLYRSACGRDQRLEEVWGEAKDPHHEPEKQN